MGFQKARQAGSGLNEGMAINHSLSALMSVVESVVMRNASAASNFRDSVLTFLMRHCLLSIGHWRMLWLIHLSPTESDFTETKNTLQLRVCVYVCACWHWVRFWCSYHRMLTETESPSSR